MFFVHFLNDGGILSMPNVIVSCQLCNNESNMKKFISKIIFPPLTPSVPKDAHLKDLPLHFHVHYGVLFMISTCTNSINNHFILYIKPILLIHNTIFIFFKSVQRRPFSTWIDRNLLFSKYFLILQLSKIS